MKKCFMKVPLLNSVEGPEVPLLNFEGGPGVPLLNFRGVPGPTLNFEGSPGSRVPGSWDPGPTFTLCCGRVGGGPGAT